MLIFNFGNATILVREADKPVVFKLGRFSRSLTSTRHLSKVNLSVNTVVLKVFLFSVTLSHFIKRRHSHNSSQSCYLYSWYVKTSMLAKKQIFLRKWFWETNTFPNQMVFIFAFNKIERVVSWSIIKNSFWW